MCVYVCVFRRYLGASAPLTAEVTGYNCIWFSEGFKGRGATFCPKTFIFSSSTCGCGLVCQDGLTYSNKPYKATSSQHMRSHDDHTSFPPSLPNPLSLYPPKLAAASNRLWALTQQTPALMLRAASSARAEFSVHTLAARPNLVLLARARASLGVLNVRTVNTGPNI